MTCRRLEDSGWLAERGSELDGHTATCLDCSASLRAHQRIAGWLAEGRTDHRPSAAWRRRTLAHVRTMASPTPAAPPAARALSREAAGAARDATSSRGEAAAVRLADAAMPPLGARPRRSRRLAVFAAIASAALVAVLVAALTPRGDRRPALVALQPSPPAPVHPARPATEPAAAPISRDPSSAAGSDARPPHADAIAPPLPGASPPRAPQVTGPVRERRGVSVIVDWDAPRDGDPSPAPAAPAAIELSIETVPRGARLLLDGAILGTTPFHRTLPRAAAGRTITLRLVGYLDGLVPLDASGAVTRRIALVPIGPRLPALLNAPWADPPVTP